MGTISVRVSNEMGTDVNKFAKEEKLEQVSEAARKLIAIGIEEWRKNKALELIEKGRVSFLKAAEIAKMNVWDFADLIKEKGIVWIRDKGDIKKDIEKALK